MRTRILPLLLCIFALARPVAAGTFDVKRFGATGDGKTLDTVALQKAIDACAAAGGGTVYFPSGRFLSGMLQLRSHVTLELSPGAVLLGSTRVADYQPKPHLLFAEDVENVAITGGGAIDGQGDAFFDRDMKPLDRIDQLIEFDHSRGIRLEGVTVRNSGNWTFRARNCDDVKVRGVSLLNNVRAVNTDGLQINSSRNVLISDCRIEGGDDCIVLKTEDGGEGPVENVTVTNCTLVSAACALKFGTGTYHDFRHCVFSNCVIRDSRTGIAIMMKDGGTIEDVRFTNIVMTTLPKWGQGLEWPIVVDVERRTNESKLGCVRDVSFDGITVYSKGRILVEGAPASPIDGLVFRNVLLRATGFENIEKGKKPRGGPKGASDDSLDYGATPAAFIFAHVRNLDLDGARLIWPDVAGAPARNAMFGEKLDGATITNFHGAASRPEIKAFNFKDCADVKS